jgi:hypothetical protein
MLRLPIRLEPALSRSKGSWQGSAQGSGRHGCLCHPEAVITAEGSQAMAPEQAIVAGYSVPVA